MKTNTSPMPPSEVLSREPWAIRFLALWERVGLPIVILLMLAIFSRLSENFLTVGNLTNIGRQVSVLALLAWGQTLVIIAAGIDLSVSAIIALVSVVTGMTFTSVGVAVGVAIALATGAAVGMINGVATAYTRIPPFVVTLATLSIVSGLALTVSGGVPIWGFPESPIYRVGNGYLLGIPVPIYVAMATFVLVWFLLNRTALGTHIYAIGGNIEAATRAGVNVVTAKLAIYSLCGFLAGVGGLILTLRVKSGQPLLGTDLNLHSIAAVVIGGTSLFGGRGRLAGTLYGVMFIGILANGLDIAGISTFVQEIVIGATLMLAVFFTSQATDNGN